MIDNDPHDNAKDNVSDSNPFVSKLRLAKVIDEAHVKYQNSFQQLSKREKEVLHYLSLGMNSRDVGKKLNISKLTVDTHRKNIYKKTELNTLRDIVLFALIFDLSCA